MKFEKYVLNLQTGILHSCRSSIECRCHLRTRHSPNLLNVLEIVQQPICLRNECVQLRDQGAAFRNRYNRIPTLTQEPQPMVSDMEGCPQPVVSFRSANDRNRSVPLDPAGALECFAKHRLLDLELPAVLD